MRIRKGDTVQVLSGKNRGKRGQVMLAIPEQGKVIVDGANWPSVTPSNVGPPCRAASSTRTCRCPCRRWPSSARWTVPPGSGCGSTRPVARSVSAASAERSSDDRRRDPHPPPPEGALRHHDACGELQVRPGAVQHHGGAAPGEDRDQHGCRKGHPAAFAHRRGGQGPRGDQRPEAGGHPGPADPSPPSSSARACPSGPR